MPTVVDERRVLRYAGVTLIPTAFALLAMIWIAVIQWTIRWGR